MKKLRLIQCGVGGFGGHWLSTTTPFSPDFDLVALVDLSPEALAKAGEQVGVPANRRFTTLEAALAAVEADAILTITPPPVHLAHCRLAFAKGLHVITEKPIAGTLEDALEMNRLAREHNRQLVVSQNYRFTPPIQAMKKLLADKKVGEFGHGHLDFYLPADFTGTFRETMDFPLLVDMAIHHLDMIRCLTGRDIVEVTARSFRPAWSWYKHEPGLKMLLELEGGLPFSYSADWCGMGRCTPWNGNWRLQCSEGSIHLDNDIVRVDTCERWALKQQSLLYDLTPLARAGQAATLHMFAESIRTGQPCELSGEKNIWSFAAVVAGVESATSGRKINVRELLQEKSGMGAVK